jgi:hypothetical protein
MSKPFNNTPSQRQSLEAFKANAAAVQVRDSIEKITGGALSGYHPGIVQ